jgi:hypothetical protein
MSRVCPLGSTSDVIAALGGTAAVARLTGNRMTTVSNWSSRRRFPARTFVVVSTELEKRGLSASPALWGMDAASSGRKSEAA